MSWKRKLISLPLVMCLMLTSLPASAVNKEIEAGEYPFTDVNQADWFYEPVKYVYENGLMTGTGKTTFSPHLTATRGMIVTILYAMESEPISSSGRFSDVADDAYYADAVKWADKNGIVSGYGNGKFGPNDPITREQTVLVLYRYAQYKKYDTERKGNISVFPDGDQVSSYAVDAMNWAIGLNLIAGMDNHTLVPSGCSARAQAATILTKFCMKFGCGTDNKTDNNISTVTGKVIAIDETVVTLQLGKLMENNTNTETPDDRNEPPEKPEGESPENTPADPPTDNNGAIDKNTPPDGIRMTFVEGKETIQLDLSGAAISKEIMGKAQNSSLNEIKESNILVAEIDSNDTVKSVLIKDIGNQPPAGGGSDEGQISQGSAASVIDTDGIYTGETYISNGDNENALRIDGADAILRNIIVDKASGKTSNTENGDFYGTNAGLLATNGASVTIAGAKVTTNAQNGNGVFCYGKETEVHISDSTITTYKDNSGGIQTTGGGTTNASNLTVETSGNSAAAIRSDRGGGIVNVTGGTYTSHGTNSPAVYSTADITVNDAQLTATGSEALVVEGKNSICLKNCVVEGNMSDTEGSSSDENVHNVMIYQSMSGDADIGTAKFSMAGGSLTSNNGDMFYITNTSCVIDLSDVNLKNNDSDANLFTITGNSGNRGWGKTGSNGAQVDFTADSQKLEGNIVVDRISTLYMTLADNSAFTGTVNIIDNTTGSAVEDNISITVEEGCTWILTGDCTLSSLDNKGTIDYNGYTITLTDGTILRDE